MKRTISRKPPSGAPAGTVWFGGPVDRFCITLRIQAEELDPDHVSTLLGCAPTQAERKGVAIHTPAGNTRIPKRGHWSLTIESKDCAKSDDVDDVVRILFARLPSGPQIWDSLTKAYTVDLFCGLFLASANRGFTISPEVSKLLSDRHVTIGFDVYFDQSGLTTEPG
jgi:hypothetical protein